MFSYVDAEARIGKDGPARKTRQVLDDVLAGIAPGFEGLHSNRGRPSIPPERLKGCNSAPCVAALRDIGLAPHVARQAKGSAIDGRAARHEGCAVSRRKRKLVEGPFGRAKTVGGMAQTSYRGRDRVEASFILAMAASNLARLPRLQAA